MTESERLLMTLGFEKRTERGSVLETFFPWDKTVNNWCKQGLPENLRPAGCIRRLEAIWRDI